ncbi:ABC-2 type transport system permease protein [Bacillus sp. RC97]|uniref:ABC-2 transporter permease n=1 Tax=Bacillus sp. RC97 TaxID=3156294 RepID=UPI00383630C5
MKGLILNSLYSVEKSVKVSLLLAILINTFLFMTKHSIALQMAIWVPFLIIPVNAFEALKHDGESGWNKYEITLPIKRSNIIKSKYITFLILLMISILLTFLILYIACIFDLLSYTKLFFSFSFRGMGIILCMAALIYPLTYLLGTAKSDAIILGSIGFAFGVFGLTSTLIPIVFRNSQDLDQAFSVTFLLISILFFIISYYISKHIYKRKEF